MKLWTLSTFCAASLLIFSGCVGSTPKPKDEIVIDKSYPVVKLTKNGIIPDMTSIAFEWESIKDPRIEGVYIYKSYPDDQAQQGELKYYKTIESRFQTHFLDKDIKPATQYTYAFKTFSKDAEGKQSKVVVVNSLPVLQSVSWIYSITDMPRVAKIIWRPHANQKVKSYIIERKTLEKDEWKELATVDGRLNAEYIDTDLKDNYVYKYRIRVVTYDGIISAPSKEVKVVTKALPKAISHITATRELPKMIKIDWEKSMIKDFDHYNLYRSDEVDGSYELIATLFNPTFTDKIEEDGKSYFYRVSELDKDGLESKHDKISIQGTTLVKPATPGVVTAKLINNSKVELQWKSNDARVKSFTVKKTEREGWLKSTSQDIEGITDTKFMDLEIKPDTQYTYIVYAVDENGIKSEPSIEVELKTQESDKLVPKQEQTKAQKEVEVTQTTEEVPTELVSPVDDLDLNGL
jgi:hypothetical protein